MHKNSDFIPITPGGLVARRALQGLGPAASDLVDVPIFSESGIEGTPNPWWGYAAPAGTPKEVVQALERILRRVRKRRAGSAH